jgi:hypothetical protein
MTGEIAGAIGALARDRVGTSAKGMTNEQGLELA